MSGSRIHFTLDDKAFTAAVAQLGGVLRTGIVRAIGVALLTQTEKRFDSGTDPFGQKWHALLPAYAAIKKGSLILVANGLLRKSLTMATSGSTVTIGSNSVYAAVHQFGATIKPVGAKALAFKLGFTNAKGKTASGIVRVKSVTIPARPYLGFGPNDQRAVLETVSGFVTRAFSG